MFVSTFLMRVFVTMSKFIKESAPPLAGNYEQIAVHHDSDCGYRTVALAYTDLSFHLDYLGEGSFPK